MASSFVLCTLIVALLCYYVILEVDAAGNLKECFSGTYDANTDYFPDKSVATVAEGFNISYHNNYKVVSSIDPTSSTETYVLFQCGTPAPSEANFPKGTLFFSIPPKTVTTDDSTASFLNALGPDVLDTIKVLSGFNPVVPCVQKGIADGRISMNTSVKTDIVFGTFVDPQNVKDISYKEDTVLKRAEWLKFFGVFFNREREANSIFKRTTKRYEIKKSLVTSSTDKPVVAIIYGYGGNLYGSQRGYKPSLIADAGGALANISSYYDSTDKLAADLQRLNVSILIDETYFFDMPSLDKVLAVYGLNQTNAQKYTWAKNVYREDKLVSDSYGYDWFSGAQIAADVVLTDFINVFNPQAPSASYERTWLRNVYTQVPTVVTAADCVDNTATMAGDKPKLM